MTISHWTNKLLWFHTIPRIPLSLSRSKPSLLKHKSTTMDQQPPNPTVDESKPVKPDNPSPDPDPTPKSSSEPHSKDYAPYPTLDPNDVTPPPDPLLSAPSTATTMPSESNPYVSAAPAPTSSTKSMNLYLVPFFFFCFISYNSDDFNFSFSFCDFGCYLIWFDLTVFWVGRNCGYS